eukprot:CAMPEP_0204624638 /NCGR_PEP_ID=MMETSP0717-20131115/10391_1 /ASSEMBLY_ACC=CAM_ASM_000666 /TAXON_ID=230516 /ORGANISM="Chaetoceros curvisetus" /LENGTH=175 /DNA_ID=CAMNT_0051640097 /DNA_START=49 /DNA_END=576 /DNA_ORIENTATION=-
MMGARRGKGSLKQSLDGTSSKKFKSEKSAVSSLNQGRGQEITGVTLPAEGNVKGWQFGSNKVVACANVDDTFYAIQGDCPRCGFDLYKGDIVTDEAFYGEGGVATGDLPRLACPTCATTYGLKNGKRGPPLKRTGLAGFVGNLAKTATLNDSEVDAKAFIISREDDSGRVFMKER